MHRRLSALRGLWNHPRHACHGGFAVNDPVLLSNLLARIGRGDEQAFGELYRHTSSKLFGVAVRTLGRRDWAEEVLQDCFVKIWQHAADYGAERSQPLTWLTSIVRNRCIDWLRRPREEAMPEDEEGQPLIELADEGPGPLMRLLDTEDAAWLARCMEKLVARERQSVALAFFYGLSHAELAEHLAQPLGTVKTWVRRGLDRLRDCLSV
jgi:RNA polymerase sigma-70 factor (ECF subfamily)